MELFAVRFACKNQMALICVVISTWATCLLSVSLSVGNLCMVTGGANLGRIGVITNRERHPGSFDVVHVKDSTGNSFATRLSNIFVIGKVSKKWIRLLLIAAL